MHFDHIGVVVPNLAQGREMLVLALGIDRWTKSFYDDGLGVEVQFGRSDQGPVYELVAPIGDNSPVKRALRDGINIVNHVAYLVADIDFEAKRLKANGVTPIGVPKNAIAYGGARIQFFVTRLRMLIELIEAPTHEHRFEFTPGDVYSIQPK